MYYVCADYPYILILFVCFLALPSLLHFSILSNYFLYLLYIEYCYAHNHDQSRPKVKVDGARRIWNTIPTCSAKAVALTISKLIPTKLDLRVKRKTKSMPNNAKSVWWFVVHGTEDDLTILERDWDKIHQQTLWSLQSYYMSPSSVLPNTENVSTINVPTINSCSDSPLATTPENENENPPAHGSSFLEEVPTPPPLQPLHK